MAAAWVRMRAILWKMSSRDPPSAGAGTIATAMALPTSALIGALYRDEVERARAMSPADKLLEGPRLFARACSIMTDGIRHQHPELDEPGIQSLIRARLARLRAVERG
jgi:hypothetical protein